MIPMDGVKVVDLTQNMAGPYCTMVLGDFGAEVTKIEPITGDNTRNTSPIVNDESYNFAMINRSKKSVVLNLKSEKGKEIFYKLAKESDIIVENFRPGVTKKLGIDYDTIKEMNPGIIYTSISGYGQTGPYSAKGGLDIIAQGMTGIMSMTGEPNGRPAKVGIAMNDIAGGSTALYSTLMAYIHKLKTGKGQYIDVSLVDAGLAWSIWESGAYFGAGEIPKQMGSRHRRNAPYQALKTKDGYVTVGAGNQRLWKRLCEQVLDKPEWIEHPLYKDKFDRVTYVDKLEADIEEIFTKENTAHWIEKLDAAGIPGGPIYTYDQTFEDPQILAREMVVEMDHPKLGKIKSLGIPAKLSETPITVRQPAPWLEQHSTERLRELGYSDQEIDELYKEEVIYNKYPQG